MEATIFWALMNFSIAVQTIPPDMSAREPVPVVSASGQVVTSSSGQIVIALGKRD
jgi:hypothetical protein